MELDSYIVSNTPVTNLQSLPDAEFKILRQLGIAPYGASTVGECFEAVRRFASGEVSGWVQAWSALGADLEQSAEAADALGRARSAGACYLRAANYFQMAEYYALLEEGAHVHFGLKSEDCFMKATQRMPLHAERVVLETGEREPSQYFLSPDDSGAVRPTVMLVPGMESSPEEIYFFHAAAALDRGYNVLVFQGPGQPGAMRKDPSSRLRHDYEVPLQVALDFLHDYPGVDSERIALVGDGIGSYFCMRVAAFDPRVKALIANPAYVNMKPLFSQMIGQRAMIVDVDLAALDELPPSILRHELKLLITNMGKRFGAARLHSLLHAMDAYSVEDLLYRIHCPVLAIGGNFLIPEMERQERLFLEGVHTDDKTLVRIPSVHYADTHNHFSNLPLLNQELLDWLDERFQPR